MASEHRLPEDTASAPDGSAANQSPVDLAEYIKLIESRIGDLNEKYTELAAKSGKENTEINSKKSKAKEKEEPKKSETEEDDVDETVVLIPELNRVTWVEWRKIRSTEAEWQRKTVAQKKREILKKPDILQKSVIDVVADTGDLGHHASADRGPAQGKDKSWTPGRIRINSEHIVDVLNEVTKIAVPTPCQILHPFKPIVDWVDDLKARLGTLQEKEREAKIKRDAVLQASLSDHSVQVESEKETQPGDSEDDSGETTPKTTAEERYTLAKERVEHYQCFIELINTNLAKELGVAEAIKNGKVEKILFSHLWHLFPPGQTIIYQDPDRIEPDQLGQVLKVSGGRAVLNRAETLRYYFYSDQRHRSKYSHFTIDSFHIDFDGNSKKYRLVQDKYEIPRFSGEVPITALKVFPIKFITKPTLSEAKEALLKRGKIFRSLASVNAAHREYHGMSLDKDKEEVSVPYGLSWQ